MQRTGMTDYAATHRGFAWDLSAAFNFDGDVVDRYAEDPDDLRFLPVNRHHRPDCPKSGLDPRGP